MAAAITEHHRQLALQALHGLQHDEPVLINAVLWHLCAGATPSTAACTVTILPSLPGIYTM